MRRGVGSTWATTSPSRIRRAISQVDFGDFSGDGILRIALVTGTPTRTLGTAPYR